ncbi:MAG: phosphate starvation-inducible protein PhoH [Candidatus Pelagibacter sp.]|nr:phosphate starvation-inducible protein PhoH [Candidatus Pelagibacter sp.]RPG10953.1 MAG: PhoH family protein [Pelagibacteraceae bacterium TMED170]|tara:strand:+ start:1747 stop:2751 length:1005 start_codon:yes stop_codon:yes gene_type:complete
MSKINKLEQNLIIKKIDKETVNIQISDNDMLMAIVGEFNKNLSDLEQLTNTMIFFRGNSITAKGKNEDISQICEAIKFLINKYLLTNIVEKNDIILSVKKIIKNAENSNVRSLKQLIKTPKKSVIARSERQADYIKALKENDIVMSIGPAGTGKSFLAVSVAITLLLEKKVERVILSRPAVEAGEKLGFLPGDMKEKVDPYLRPLYDALYDLFGFEKIQRMIESGEIEIAPLAFMRGRTLKNSFAILDEAQNATSTQIKMFLTRIGENSKLVVNGDPSQIDLVNMSHSGLLKSKKILNKIKEIKIIEFDHKDVVRHPLVSKIIQAYQSKIDDQS